MRYEAPATSRDAAAILAKSKETAFVLGGGTDVLVKMRTGLIEPDLLVDIKAIPAMKGIKVSDKEDRHDPFEKYINEIYKNEFCISPLKSLSIHLTNVNSSYGLSPFINYKDLWDQNE